MNCEGEGSFVTVALIVHFHLKAFIASLRLCVYAEYLCRCIKRDLTSISNWSSVLMLYCNDDISTIYSRYGLSNKRIIECSNKCRIAFEDVIVDVCPVLDLVKAENVGETRINQIDLKLKGFYVSIILQSIGCSELHWIVLYVSSITCTDHKVILSRP